MPDNLVISSLQSHSQLCLEYLSSLRPKRHIKNVAFVRSPPTIEVISNWNEESGPDFALTEPQTGDTHSQNVPAHRLPASLDAGDRAPFL